MAGAGGELAAVLPWWSAVPFAGLLLSIALVPQVFPHFWHSARNQWLTALGWAAPVVGLLGVYAAGGGPLGAEAGRALVHAVEEYGSFIVLLGALYTITGGIHLKGDLRATPRVNTAFLAVGAVLANAIGTTGASMLLIRPLLRTNLERRRKLHVPVFFIFVVSNLGGALTPIGDPPLFLGYLRGVPFFWTVEHIGLEWLVAVGSVLAVFFAWDTWAYRHEAREDVARDDAHVVPLSVHGGHNFALLAGVVAAVLLLTPDRDAPGFRDWYAREAAMLALAGLSVWSTPRRVRDWNNFDYGPIQEVAALFAGIFLAMIPATHLLEANGARLGVSAPWQYFWASGLLSSFLDNAPTYVTFAATACGTFAHCTSAEHLDTLAAHPDSAPVLAAIAMGAVFMGANSYIGNGPNFMVRAIAVQAGYEMPSFFGYVAWAALVLGPVFVLLTVLFL